MTFEIALRKVILHYRSIGRLPTSSRDYVKWQSCLCTWLLVFKASMRLSNALPSFFRACQCSVCGHLSIYIDLRAHGIHCTEDGADWAAANGHVDVVRDLRAHGIHCTSSGANWAAENGHVDVIQDMRADGIHCTPSGDDGAAANGHVDMFRHTLDWVHGSPAGGISAPPRHATSSPPGSFVR